MSLRLTALQILIALGLALSAYMTIAHYTNTQLACPNTGAFNCEEVTTSQYSMILGVPVALLGLALFLLAVLMVLGRNETLIFLWAFAGAMSVLYSLGSMALIGTICVYCTTLDAIIVLTAIVSNVGIRKTRQ